eukprot:181777_1
MGNKPSKPKENSMQRSTKIATLILVLLIINYARCTPDVNTHNIIKDYPILLDILRFKKAFNWWYLKDAARNSHDDVKTFINKYKNASQIKSESMALKASMGFESWMA